jgi:CheY-like chemotaxis protein
MGPNLSHNRCMRPLEKGLRFNWNATEEQRAVFHYARTARPLRRELVILLVEDQRFFQQVFRSALGIHQPVVIANNAKEGWDMYFEHAPDIAFLDVQMEGMSGHELAWGLNRLDADGFIVMLTAANDIESMAEADENGARAFISKPYNQKKLLDCIARYHASHPRLMD